MRSSAAASSRAAASGNRRRTPSTTRRSWARALAWSGCAKIVRTTAATASRAALGTRARRLRMKCTRHRCQLAPVSTVATARLRPSGASEITNRTPRSPRATSPRRNAVQKASSSAGPASTPSTCRSPSAVTPIAATVAMLITRPSWRTLWYVASNHTYGYSPSERPAAERLHLHVEGGAHPRHLRLRDALEAQRLHEVIDLARRDPVHVGLLHHRRQRPLAPPPRLEQARKVAPRPHFRDRELEGPDPCVPGPQPEAVAVRRSLPAALVRLRTHQGRHLCLHQRLRQYPHPLAQNVGLLLGQELAHERGEVHPPLGHRLLPHDLACPAITGGRCAMAILFSTPPSAAPSFRISTTSGDTNSPGCETGPEGPASEGGWDAACCRAAHQRPRRSKAQQNLSSPVKGLALHPGVDAHDDVDSMPRAVSGRLTASNCLNRSVIRCRRVS